METNIEHVNGTYYNIEIIKIEDYINKYADYEDRFVTKTYLRGKDVEEHHKDLFVPKRFTIKLKPKEKILRVPIWNWDDEISMSIETETLFFYDFTCPVPLKDDLGEYLYYDKDEYSYFENFFVMGVWTRGFRYTLNQGKFFRLVADILIKETSFTEEEVNSAIGDIIRKRYA